MASKIDELQEMWNDFITTDHFIFGPLRTACFEIVVLSVTNLCFSQLNYTIYRYTNEPMFFVILAALVGTLHLYLFSTWHILKFVAGTSIGFGFLFFICILIREYRPREGRRLVGLVKFGAFCYGLVCFRYYQDQNDVDQYVMHFVIMTLKLISASLALQTYTFEELMGGEGRLASPFEVMAYLMYTGWPSYRDFFLLRGRQFVTNERWMNMMISRTWRAVAFKFVSANYIPKDFSFFYIPPDYLPLFLIRAFQMRCKYYYRAQLAELEIIAGGLRRGNWNRPIVFDVFTAEYSYTISEVLLFGNLMLGSYLRNEFTRDETHPTAIILNLGCLLILIGSFDLYYCYFMVFYIIGIFTERIAIHTFVNGEIACDIFGTHTHLPPTRGSRNFDYFTGTTFQLILWKQARLSAASLPFFEEGMAFGMFLTLFPIIFDLMMTFLYRDYLEENYPHLLAELQEEQRQQAEEERRREEEERQRLERERRLEEQKRAKLKSRGRGNKRNRR